MTDRGSAVPNTRSPGTPVCHPADTYQPPTPQEPTRVSMNQDSEYVELHATSAFSFLAGASQPEALNL